MLKIPVIKLTADSKPLNDLIMSRLMTLTVTDNKSTEADELTLTLDDHDGKLQLPKRGVTLQCWLGFSDSGTHDMGQFTVDAVEWGGAPDTITVKAKSADMKGSLKQTRSQSYHDKKLGEIAGEIATRHSLKLTVNSELSALNIGHIDQTDESDMHLLSRLCHDYGAVMNIKHGQLLIFKANQNQTVSGSPLSLTTIARRIGDQYRYSIEDRETDYTGVTASYQDKPKATKATVAAKKTDIEASKTDNKSIKTKNKTASVGKIEPRGGGDDPNLKSKHIKGVFKDKNAAEAAANAEMTRLNDNQAKFSITTAYAYPAISTESPIKLQGFKPEIDALNWTVDKATHNYTKSNGLTTQLDLVASLK